MSKLEDPFRVINPEDLSMGEIQQKIFAEPNGMLHTCLRRIWLPLMMLRKSSGLFWMGDKGYSQDLQHASCIVF
jgi:hypothetical protein